MSKLTNITFLKMWIYSISATFAFLKFMSNSKFSAHPSIHKYLFDVFFVVLSHSCFLTSMLSSSPASGRSKKWVELKKKRKTMSLRTTVQREGR